jgi:hypothetical protein
MYDILPHFLRGHLNCTLAGNNQRTNQSSLPANMQLLLKELSGDTADLRTAICWRLYGLRAYHLRAKRIHIRGGANSASTTIDYGLDDSSYDYHLY